MATTRVSIGFSGLGVTVRQAREATDLLLTSDDHPHKSQLLVPMRHLLTSELAGTDDGDYTVFSIQGCDVSVPEMPSGAVKFTRGLRKPIGTGKREPKPEKLDHWRDVAWGVDFDFIEQAGRFNRACLNPTPPSMVAARVKITGGDFQAALPLHRCLRIEQYALLNALGAEQDRQVVADSLYHLWETQESQITITVTPFGGATAKTISLAAVGGVIAGVRFQSTPTHPGVNEPCGSGTMEHYRHLYSVLEDVAPGSARLVNDGERSPIVVNEFRRCGRAVISE